LIVEAAANTVVSHFEMRSGTEQSSSIRIHRANARESRPNAIGYVRSELNHGGTTNNSVIVGAGNQAKID
jgi:hypothetical protein